VRAIEVLGRVGTDDDRLQLAPLLSDPEWWVRYRAAQALCALSTANLDRLTRMSTSHRDPFARDILAHALAERRYA
jgi:HEAT repeat protein